MTANSRLLFSKHNKRVAAGGARSTCDLLCCRAHSYLAFSKFVVGFSYGGIAHQKLSQLSSFSARTCAPFILRLALISSAMRLKLQAESSFLGGSATFHNRNERQLFTIRACRRTRRLFHFRKSRKYLLGIRRSRSAVKRAFGGFLIVHQQKTRMSLIFTHRIAAVLSTVWGKKIQF